MARNILHVDMNNAEKKEMPILSENAFKRGNKSR